MNRGRLLDVFFVGCAFAAIVAGCGGGGQARQPADGGPDGASDGSAGQTDCPADVAAGGTTGADGAGARDGTVGDTGDAGPPVARKTLGMPCAAALECESEFCADGVCCGSACTEACRTCVGQGSVGTCLPAELGTDPRNECPDQGIAGCGTSGACDGAGACAKYPAGAVCKAQACAASTLTSAFRCDGNGTCLSTPGQSCAPFNCAADGRCMTVCMADSDCVAPNSCINGSCGKKPLGGACGSAGECNSGFCEQGVCCGAACSGTCRSCAVPGSVGTCTSVPDGADPLGQCADQGAPSCGSDGACDGRGACRVYASGTVCVAPTCSGATATLPGRCNGTGTCVLGTQQGCEPYACGSAGQCQTACTANTSCSGGNVCVGTICAKRAGGADCATSTECASGFCQQGVCCAGSCTGICSSCALAGTRGVCTAIPANTDPLNQCADAGSASCGTDGSCNGAGACRLYAPGVVCSVQSCAGSTLTLAGRCNGTGSCGTGSTQSCSPYVCGGNSCQASCTTSAGCTSGNVCTASSCGLKPLGAACGAGTECDSRICAQGVCCGTACNGTCMSCALSGTGGTCSTVPAGQDPLGQCNDQGAPSCGTDGFCDGTGACRRHASGTACAAAMCTAGSHTPERTCNGAGVCQAATAVSCGAYNCGTSGTCRTACASNADCAAPNICNAGQCSKKPLAAACTTAAECASGLCQQGVCCGSTCTGTCRSCALAGSGGTCTFVPVGADPLEQCADNGMPSCGTDGLCDGAGACRLYAAGTTCVGATCTGSTFSPARTCNGTGTCQTTSASSCDPYVCGASAACRASCTSNADCTSPNSCVGGSCGKKPIGTACAAAAECHSNLCEQGVCCATACAGTCRSCALPGTVGTCASAAAGEDPLNQCASQGEASCGTDGTCDGSGACRRYASGTTCAPSTCAGTTFTPARTCDGAGTCGTATATNCGAYVCGAGGSCQTSCDADNDCVAPNVCTGGSCGKRPNGAVCTAAGECASNFCEQGVCCLTACTGSCRSCALPATAGACTLVAAGEDPLGQCAASNPLGCGTDGFCDGGGACRLHASGTVCVDASCAGATFTPARTCNGTGTCQATTASSCGPYSCAMNVCRTSCATDADCLAPNVCIAGACTKKTTGMACAAAGECMTNLCEQGMCCASACTGTCQSCALPGTAGTCTNVPTGQDPLGQCATSATSTCGTDGSCNGTGGCRLYALGTSCGDATCAGSTLTSARACNGTGTCQAATTSMCTPYACGAGACRTTCTVNSDCMTPFSCIGGSCTTKPLGAACAAGGECDSNACAQGVCCATACAGTCQSCALAGSVGTCTNVPAGVDPLNQCADLGNPTCSTDGQCNGAGACRLYAAGSQCAAAMCSGTTFTPARACNGSGTCQTATTSSCAPYACGGAACRSTCTTTAECASPNTCAGGSCGLLPISATCSTDAQCNSGICAQGICCGSVCTGTCRSCAVAGSLGTCSNVPNGLDPLDQCTDAGAAGCGADGTCNGSGACRLYVAGTQCAGAMCTGSTFTPSQMCNGTGTCQAVTTSSCTPYQCGTAGTCRTTCASDADCVAPNICSGGACTKRPNGATCAAAGDCASNICAQGICCATACTATCRSCALPGALLGTCSNVPAGADPLNQCTDAGSMSCGNDGTCNGAGACRLYVTGTQCVAPACSGSTFTPARTCNGTGTCQTVANAACSPYACGTGACRTSCTSNADCLSPNVCIGSACAPAPNLKVQYLAFDKVAGDQSVKPHFKVVNTGTNTVQLQTLTIRYWYTIDGPAPPALPPAETSQCDFAVRGCNNITLANVTLSPTRTGADRYFQVGFAAGAGSLGPNSNTGEIQVWFHKNDWSNYNESGDYSFDAANSGYVDWGRATLYQNGTLIWGTEP